MKRIALLGVFLFFNTASQANHQFAMGSVGLHHHFHHYPIGYRAVWGVPWAYWTGYTFAYGYGASYYYVGNNYGSISYSTTTGAYGWSVNWSDPYTARSVSMRGCRAADCREVMWFANACGALANSETDKKVFGWAWNTYGSLAEQTAMDECSRGARDCRIIVSLCTR